MTGRYQQRFGFEYNPDPKITAADDLGLPRSEATIADPGESRNLVKDRPNNVKMLQALNNDWESKIHVTEKEQ